MLEGIEAYLLQVAEDQPPPPHKDDMRLVDEYMQPIFAGLRDLSTTGQKDRNVILDEILQTTAYEWFKRDNGSELECHLEHLALREQTNLFKQPRITTDWAEVMTPGVMVEVTVDEAESLGLIEEPSVTAEGAWEANTPSYSMVDLGNKKVEGHQYSTGTGALLFAVGLMRQRIEAKCAQRKRRRKEQEPPNVYFCELCDDLTQWMSRGKKTSPTGSKRYCESHSDRTRCKKDNLKKCEFDWLYRTVLFEASRDASYLRRLLGPTDAYRHDAVEHISSCPSCSGKTFQLECFDASKKYFPELLTFHANARKVAYHLAHSYYDSRAYSVDCAVQKGGNPRETARFYRLNSDKAFGQYCGLATARLLHQRAKGAEIAARLGLSESAVSQRKSALSGCFDFGTGRDLNLIWWPFDDIAGSNIARFPTRALGEPWRHSVDEYHHLVVIPDNTAKHQRWTTRSSSLSTRSSARR
jgi:hypothetical protein